MSRTVREEQTLEAGRAVARLPLLVIVVAAILKIHDAGKLRNGLLPPCTRCTGR
jgi:hypothetical protein